MKNIIIIGAEKTGKTTLSKMIKDKYNSYNLIDSDSLKKALIKAEGNEEEFKQNVDKLKHFEFGETFLYTVMEFFKILIENDKNKYGYILESAQLHPLLIKQKLDFEKTKVICLGYGDMSIDDIVKQCIKYDTKENWSYNLPKEELQKHAKYWFECNQIYKTECPKYGIEYIDTSKDREKTLNSIVEHIII